MALKDIVITEVLEQDGSRWLMNINKLNDATDLEIPEELAKYILKRQQPSNRVNPFTFAEVYPNLYLHDFNVEEAYEMGVSAGMDARG